MGILETLLGRSPPDVEPVALRPGESEIVRTPACLTKGGVSWVGGDLILTNQRLIFTPINTNDLVKLTSLGLKVVRIPHANQVMTVIGWAQKLIKQVDTDSDVITSAAVGRYDAGLIHPPTIVIQRSTGAPLEFGIIGGGRLTPTGSSKNVVARDNFLGSIRDVLAL
jgi:hypothetical protein